MSTTRSITISLALALAAIAPATALARNGADDNPAVPDDKGGQQVATGGGADDKGGQRAATGTDDKDSQRAKGAQRARRERRVAGTCTGTSTSKLKVRLRDARLTTEFEVDENVDGVAWAVKLSRNGTVAVTTTRTTHAPSGSFSIELRLRDGAGSDTIAAEATSPTGEVCSASITI